jgi:hypothetical protein
MVVRTLLPILLRLLRPKMDIRGIDVRWRASHLTDLCAQYAIAHSRNDVQSFRCFTPQPCCGVIPGVAHSAQCHHIDTAVCTPSPLS